MKTCKTCGISKTIEEFPKSARASGTPAPRPHCKSCVNDKNRDSARMRMQAERDKDPDAFNAKVRQWRAENRDKHLSYRREYERSKRRSSPKYKNHEQKILEAQAGRLIRAIVKVAKAIESLDGHVCWLWSKPGLNSKDKYAIRYELDHKFRAREILRCYSKKPKFSLCTPAWADHKEMRKIYAEACLINMNGGDVNVDHIVPIVSDVVCGLHVHQNLRIIPRKENMEKLNSFSDELLTSWDEASGI